MRTTAQREADAPTGTPDAQRAIAGWSSGGRLFSATAVEIDADPAWPGLAQRLPERLPALVAHERHT